MPWNDLRDEFFIGVDEVLRQEFRAAPTQPAPVFADEDLVSSDFPIPPAPRTPSEINTIAASYDDLLRVIDELKAGRPPEDDFEHEICAAIQRNQAREVEEAVSHPSRFDRILDRVG